MKPQTLKTLNQLRDFLFMSVGIVSYVIGYVCFQLPYHITGGGVAGLASVIYFGSGVPPQYTYLVVNIFLLILALKILGIKFMVNTIYAVAFMTIAITVAQKIMMVNGSIPQILGSQSFMACVIGAAM